jgi:hypothetical protein
MRATLCSMILDNPWGLDSAPSQLQPPLLRTSRSLRPARCDLSPVLVLRTISSRTYIVSPALTLPHSPFQQNPVYVEFGASLFTFMLIARPSSLLHLLDFRSISTPTPLQVVKQGSHSDAAIRNHCLSCMQSAVLEGLP